LPSSMAFEALGSGAIPETLLTESRAAASAVGYAHGWAQGMHEAREAMAGQVNAGRVANEQFAAERNAALELALHALATAAASIEAKAVAVTAEIEESIAQGAVLIAEALIGRELVDDAEATRTAIRRALQLTPANETVTVRINAQVWQALSPEQTSLLLASFAQSAGRSVSLIPDATLAPADAIAIAGATTIDARLTDAVRRVRERLSL
jgi:flagellar assembly protein FliH